MSTPHRCPVCNGRGSVPAGFYAATPAYMTSTFAGPELCRACNGAGVLWESVQANVSVYASGGIWSDCSAAQGGGS